MKFELKPASQSQGQAAKCIDLDRREPLVWLRDIERSLRCRTLTALVPVLPKALAINLGETSLVAEESMNQLAQIDLDAIDATDLQPARIKVGLFFTGFGALMMLLLLLYLSALHPELNSAQQLHHYWYAYIWFVCLGVAGLFMLGREAMRPPQ
ncbi:MAG: hypothetical protein ACAF41_23155 [Leptolyngbya sp. BL-A-14]